MANTANPESYRIQRLNELIEHTIDWSDWLETGDSITVSNWTVEAPSGQVTIGAPINTGVTATVSVAGGVPGEVVKLTNIIGTANGHIGERAIWLRIV